MKNYHDMRQIAIPSMPKLEAASPIPTPEQKKEGLGTTSPKSPMMSGRQQVLKKSANRSNEQSAVKQTVMSLRNEAHSAQLAPTAAENQEQALLLQQLANQADIDAAATREAEDPHPLSARQLYNSVAVTETTERSPHLNSRVYFSTASMPFANDTVNSKDVQPSS